MTPNERADVIVGEFVAHAVRDYLRHHGGADDLKRQVANAIDAAVAAELARCVRVAKEAKRSTGPEYNFLDAVDVVCHSIELRIREGT